MDEPISAKNNVGRDLSRSAWGSPVSRFRNTPRLNEVLLRSSETAPEETLVVPLKEGFEIVDLAMPCIGCRVRSFCRPLRPSVKRDAHKFALTLGGSRQLVPTLYRWNRETKGLKRRHSQVTYTQSRRLSPRRSHWYALRRQRASLRHLRPRTANPGAGSPRWVPFAGVSPITPARD